jgi:hypothetical protein
MENTATLLFRCHERDFEIWGHPDEALVFTSGMAGVGWPELCAADSLAGDRAETALLLADLCAVAHDDPRFAPRARLPFHVGETEDDLVLVGLDAVQARVMTPIAKLIGERCGVDDVELMVVEIAA